MNCINEEIVYEYLFRTTNEKAKEFRRFIRNVIKNLEKEKPELL